jgi:hypothetical protein
VKNSFYVELERAFDKFLKYHVNILLGDINAKVGREGLLRPTILSENSQETSNDNEFGVLYFSTSKILTVKSITISHRDV